MTDKSVIATTIGVAGAGFRLSLLLNAVGVKMATANREIQAIAKEISLFSLTLKQVGLTLDTPEAKPSWNALETANGIALQSQAIFTQIKDMAEMSQKWDEQGNIRSITISGKAQSWFRKKRVQYLLGQLVLLKLSLSIMLQVLQLGKNIATTRQDNSNPLHKSRDVLQEEAEIQNMVVVRQWSLVDLQRLYQLAEDEAVHPHNSPSPDTAEMKQLKQMKQIEGDPRLSITSTAHEDNTSKEVVTYQETPLSQLEASLNRAMYQPNRLLHSPDIGVVDRLLHKWTRSHEVESRAGHTSHYRARVDTDSDDTDSDSDRPNGGGYYLEGPPQAKSGGKSVRFLRTQVEDGEDSDQARSRQRAPKKVLMRPSSEDSSSCTSDSEDLPQSRRSSASSTTSRRPPELDPNGGSRPYPPSGAYTRKANTEIPPAMPNHPRGGPPSPRISRPVPIPNHPRAPPSPGLRPYQHPPSFGPPQHPKSGSSYIPSSIGAGHGSSHGGYSPHTRANMFPPAAPPPPPAHPNGNSFSPPTHRSEPRRSTHRSHKRDRRDSGRGSGSSFRESAKEGAKDVKRGLLGAGAVAGLLDILEGLSAI